MKPPRTSVSNHLLKPPSSVAFCSPKPGHKSPFRTLVSFFLTLNSDPTQTPPPNSSSCPSSETHRSVSNQFPESTTFRDLTSSSNSQNNDFGDTQLPNSLKQSIPTIKTNLKSNVLPPGPHNNEPINAHFFGLSKKSKPTIKTIFFDPIVPKLTQTRLFSAESSDPFRKPLNSAEPNSPVSNPIPVISTVNSPVESSPPIDAGSSIRKPVSLWPGMYHSPVTNALWEARSCIFEVLSTTDAPPQTELVTKTPSQSRTSILYKFSGDYILREQYKNPWNAIRMGKLLEDLDALAGTISYKALRLLKSLFYFIENWIIPIHFVGYFS